MTGDGRVSAGVWGSALLSLCGLWLMLAPRLAGGHLAAGPWTDPVRDDVVVGGALMLLGAAAILVHVGHALAETLSGGAGDGQPRRRRSARGARRRGG